jgi:hypothetical protein
MTTWSRVTVTCPNRRLLGRVEAHSLQISKQKGIYRYLSSDTFQALAMATSSSEQVMYEGL